MNWLTQNFTGQSIAWLVISTIFALIAGVASSWLTYRVVTRQQIRDTVAAEIEKQRGVLNLETRKEKEERIRKEIIHWANPILGAVQDLEFRLNNILHRDSHPVLSEKYEEGDIPGWSISYEYFVNSTLYLFGQYFAWIRMLQEELSFELFESQQEKDAFFDGIAEVASTLSSFPPERYSSCSGEDVQVFRLQQRAIGEIMIYNESDNRRCLSYPDFLQELKKPQFYHHLEPLVVLLKDLQKPEDQCRWRRLEATRQALAELRTKCEELVTLPQQSESPRS